MKVYIVERKTADGQSVLLEVYDTKKKANEAVVGQLKHYPFDQLAIIERDVLND